MITILLPFCFIPSAAYLIISPPLPTCKHYFQEFEESFKIIIAIINAYADTNKLNFDSYIVEQFPTLGMFLRIINRKGNERTKIDMDSWLVELKSLNYHNNLYLEDIVEMINFNK